MYDYRYEPHNVVFMIDNKSFFASCEAIELGLNPMKAVLAVASHQQDEESYGSGLIMAASPLAKAKYGLNNVMRVRDVPSKKEAPDLILVPPHMNLYIRRSTQILEIFHQFAADEDIHPYSIDESMIDMTKSWHLFGDDPYLVARKIQLEIKNKLGFYTTCGIGENPLLAKLSMDISAKHRHSMIDYWHYIDVPDTIWQIKDMEEVCGIGKRTAKHLRRLNINNMYELAHSDPAILKKEFGVMGEQLFAMSWGVDRSIIREQYFPKMKNYGNSQILTRDYTDQREIEIVLREISEQVAARIRSHKVQTGCISLMVNFSKYRLKGKRKGFNVQQKVCPTNDNDAIAAEVLALFRKNWHGERVRALGVSCGDLHPDNYQQLTFFVQPSQQIKKKKIDQTVDQIRQKYGFTSLVKASSLLHGATAIKRSSLVGGHNGGNAYD